MLQSEYLCFAMRTLTMKAKFFFLRSYVTSMAQLYTILTTLIKPLGGNAVRELFDRNLRKVKKIEDIRHDGKYLACEGGGPTKHKKRLKKFQSDYLMSDY